MKVKKLGVLFLMLCLLWIMIPTTALARDQEITYTNIVPNTWYTISDKEGEDCYYRYAGPPELYTLQIEGAIEKNHRWGTNGCPQFSGVFGSIDLCITPTSNEARFKLIQVRDVSAIAITHVPQTVIQSIRESGREADFTGLEFEVTYEDGSKQTHTYQPTYHWDAEWGDEYIYYLADDGQFYVPRYDESTQTLYINAFYVGDSDGLDSDGYTVRLDGFTGFQPIKDMNGWWYFKNGAVDTSMNSVVQGVVNGTNAWWYVKNGQVDFDYTGIAQNAYGWWRIVNGKVDFGCNSVEQNEHGWWYIRNGKVDFGYSGVAQNAYGWWRIVNGKVDFNCNSVEQNEHGWWYIRNGKVDFGYSGVAQNAYGWWRIVNGKVDFGYTGLAQNAYGWWRIEKGKVNFSFNGIASNAYGKWYLQKGKVQFQYTGKIIYQGKAYTIRKGKVVG